MAGTYLSKIFHAVTLVTVLGTAMSMLGCVKKPPELPASTSSGSTGGSDGGGVTPGPISTTPKNVQITWAASRALGVPAGGYKVYVKLNAIPTTTNTTPLTIANAGLVHTTTTTMSLAPGKYYISVSAYSADGDSALSTPYVLQVP